MQAFTWDSEAHFIKDFSKENAFRKAKNHGTFPYFSTSEMRSRTFYISILKGPVSESGSVDLRNWIMLRKFLFRTVASRRWETFGQSRVICRMPNRIYRMLQNWAAPQLPCLATPRKKLHTFRPDFLARKKENIGDYKQNFPIKFGWKSGSCTTEPQDESFFPQENWYWPSAQKRKGLDWTHFPNKNLQKSCWVQLPSSK